MTKYIHCVFVRHEENENDKTYLFHVASHEKIKNGTKVLCKTIQGEVTGRCIGDSFMVSENALKSIVDGVGAYLPLKDVIGIITTKYVLQNEVNRFDVLPF
jgi:hypothetical protein